MISFTRLRMKPLHQILLLLSCLTSILCSEKILLPSTTVNVDEFLDTYSAYNKYTVDRKEVNTTILAYVTPWNRIGYKVAEIFAAKFDLISPVWFQILNKKKAYTVTGIPDVDSEWIARLRNRNPAVKIVPRFIFEQWSGDDFAIAFDGETESKACIAKILRVVNNYNFDGAVLEVWSQFGGVGTEEVIEFVRLVASELHDANKLFILVIPPPVYQGGHEGRFLKSHFDRLYNSVDFFSLMTYDYSSPVEAGPISPIEWVRDCIERLVPSYSVSLASKRAKLLTGFNLYGRHYVKGNPVSKAVMGHEFVALVRMSRGPFRWDEKFMEHYLETRQPDGTKYVIYYPTLMSIARRLSLVANMSTGVSLWEIGQGLNSFYSLF